MFQNLIISKILGNSARSKKTPLENCFTKLVTKFGRPTTIGTWLNHVPKISLEAEAEEAEEEADSFLAGISDFYQVHNF